MELLKDNKEKICSFYVNNWHLTTMILPYINKELDEKVNIVMFIQNSIEENIKTLISKLNLKNEKRILKLNWGSAEGLKYSDLKKKMEFISREQNTNNIILISGSKEYIDSINKNIDKWMEKNKEFIKVKKFKIIDSYEVGEFNNSIKEILEKHTKIINTSGEKSISEVFDGYSNIKEIC